MLYMLGGYTCMVWEQSMTSCWGWCSGGEAWCWSMSMRSSRWSRSFSCTNEACCGIEGDVAACTAGVRDWEMEWNAGMSAISSGNRVKKSMPIVHELMSEIRSSNAGDIWYWPVTKLFL